MSQKRFFSQIPTNDIKDFVYDSDTNEDVNYINTTDEIDEFSTFIKEIKHIDMCNLFVDQPKSFGFGNYFCCLMKLLNVEAYKNKSLQSIVRQLKPNLNLSNVSDEDFLFRLLDFTISVVNEPKLEEASMEILLLFNLLNSPHAIIKRDDTNDSDAPALIATYSTHHHHHVPSRLRYFISLNIMDVYEFSCKPDLLMKRIRHSSYQEKCKSSAISKYMTDFFLNSLNLIKYSIRDDMDIHDETMKQYKCFLKNMTHIIKNDDAINLKNLRQKLKHDTVTVQNYPSVRSSLITETLNGICKMSLSIERYVATRTGGIMENENYQYPCFLHFIT